MKLLSRFVKEVLFVKHEIHLAALATAACLTEVHTAPKPGLVDRIGPGAHKDMDYTTFLSSIMALAPHWPHQASIGITGVTPGDALPLLRQEGLRMEQDMFAETGGINTHKGLVFAMSLLLYGAGFIIASGHRLTPERIAKTAAVATSGCCDKELESLKSFPPSRKLTSGEKIFLDHGLRGIRGEVEDGFPTVVGKGLPALRKALGKGADLNDSALYALFHLMDGCEDTNIVARKGYSFWKGRYREMLLPLLAITPPFSEESRGLIHKMDALFSAEGISPGGAADLLTCTLFLHWTEGYPNHFVNITPR